MHHDDVAYLAKMLRRRSGLLLTQPKAHLIESRLAPVARRFGFKDVDAMIRELRHGSDALARAVTEAMTTNESSFFRDRSAFDQFRDKILPALLVQRAASMRLRIWSAACAAGQEAYSIAMILDDQKLLAQGWSIDLIATDISSEMIARAEQGVYSHFEVQRGLPIRRLIAHFTQEDSSWRISETMRRMVTFRPFNLLDSFGWLEDVDIVFCRNVMIYFDHKTKVSVLDKIAEVLAPDGYLMLAPVETVRGASTDLAPVEGAPGLYAKNRAPILLAS